MNDSEKNEVIQSLFEVINQRWVEGASEEWDLGWFSPNTVHQMAVAAAQVVFAQSESQEYAVREGYLNKE